MRPDLLCPVRYLRLVGAALLDAAYRFISGFFEALGALLTLMALTTEPVVVVSPIVATTPLFRLAISLLFFRGKEKVTALTIVGTV